MKNSNISSTRVAIAGTLTNDGAQLGDNLMLTSAEHNAAYPELSQMLRSVLPSTHVGIGIALLDTSSSSLLSKLESRKVDMLRSVYNAANNWVLSMGSMAGETYSFGTKPLGLSELMLSSMAMNSEQAAVYQKVILTGHLQLKDKLAALAGKMLDGKYDKISSKVLSGSDGQITGVEGVNIILSGLQKGEASSVLAGVFSMDNLLASMEGVLDEEEMKILILMLDQKEYSSLFGHEAISLWYEIAIYALYERKDLGDTKISKDIKEKTGRLTNVAPLGDWKQSLVAAIAYDSLLSESVGKGEVFGSDITKLMTQFTKSITDRSAEGVRGAYEALTTVSTFSRAISSYYSEKKGTLDHSYRKGNELMLKHRSLLVTLRNAMDATSARNAINTFISSSEFRKSVAGILYAILNNEDIIDSALVNDLLTVVVDRDVIASFNKSPFSEKMTLRIDQRGRVADYGTGISGITIRGHVRSETKIDMGGVNGIQINDIDHSKIASVWDTPWDLPVNANAYRIMATSLLGRPDIHAKLSGMSELSGLADEFGYSKQVRDELLPIIRMVNNCVGAQLYIHKRASEEWLKQTLYGVIDLTNFGINLISVERDHIAQRMYGEAAVTNMKEVRTLCATMLKNIFNVDVATIPDKALPVIKIKDSESSDEYVEDMNDIVSKIIHFFRKRNDTVMMLTDNLKHYSRIISATGANGLDYSRANRAVSIKDSLLTGYNSMFSSRPTDIVSVDIAHTRTVRPDMRSVDQMMDKAFRNDQGLKWFMGCDISSLLDLAIRNGELGNINFQSLGSRFSRHAEQHFGFPNFIVDYLRSVASDTLNHHFKSDTFSHLRNARAVSNLSYNAMNILRLATGPFDGLVYGYSPNSHIITSDNDNTTLDRVLSAVGIKSDSYMSSNDIAFLDAVHNYSRLGGVLTLTNEGEELRKTGMIKTEDESMTEFLNRGRNIKISTLVRVKHSVRGGTRDAFAFVFYTRPHELLQTIFEDYFVEDFSSSYDVTVVEDAYLRSLRSSGFDDLIMTVSHDYPLGVNDIEDASIYESSAFAIADNVAKFIFPKITGGTKATKTGAKDDDVEDEDERPEDIN